MSNRTAEDHASETSPTMRGVKGMIRRLQVTFAAATARWQVRGVRASNGGDEIFDAELFPGIGIFARPPADGSPEAIVANVGGSKSPAIVATRDEKTRKKVAQQVQPGETAIYNASSVVIIRADGTIEIRTHGGTAQLLATKADIDKFMTLFSGWTPTGTLGDAGLLKTAYTAAFVTVPYVPGTKKIKGE